MKKQLFISGISFLFFAMTFAQTDTISTNIYQENGNLGIGVINPSSRFEMICNEAVTTPAYGILSIKNNHYATFDAFSASDIPHIGSLINGRRSRGTLLNPEHVQAGDRLSGLISAMYYNNQFYFNSSVEFFAENNLNSTSLPSYISFQTTGKDETIRSERMRLSGDGNLGIGTREPVEKLHIKNGDIYLEDINGGIIMKSPNGQCWKGTLDNNGQLVFNLIECPVVEYNTTYREEQNPELDIFPNPTKGQIIIELLNRNINNLRYLISDSIGRIVSEGDIQLQSTTIDMTSFSSGLYLVSVTDNTGQIISSKKVIKE